MKKRLLSAILAVCTAVGNLSVPAAAAEPVQVQEAHAESSARVSGHTLSKDWTWRYYDYDDGTVAVCEYCRTSPDGKLVIPEKIDGKKVVEVGYLNEEFVVPDKRMIKNVTIPATVTDMAWGVFKHYSWITDLTILGDVWLGGGELEGCTALKTLTVGQDSINMEDLEGSPVTTINFAEGVKNASVWGWGQTTKGGQYGKNLTTVNLPRSVTSFSASCCPNLISVNCPKSFSQIDLTLRDCPKLHMEAWVKGYFMKDFSNTGITKITIDVSSWGKYGWKKECLKGCPYLKEIVLTGKNDYYFIKDGMLCWKKKKNSKEYDILAYPAGKSAKGNFTIPKNVKCVYNGAFDSCKFNTITIPENITSEWYWDSSYGNQASSLLRGNQAVLCLVKGSVADNGDGNAAKMAKSLNVKKKRIRYQLGSTYRISYKLNGGVNAAGNPTSYRAGQIKKLKKPTRKGYTFLGWKRNGSKGYENTTERHSGTFKDYTFTACWKKDNSSKPGNGDKKPDKNTVTKPDKKVLGRISGVKVKAQSGGKCRVSWKKASKVSGYQIRYSTKTNMKSSRTVKIAGAKKNKVVLKKLKKGSTYSVQVRAYQKAGKKMYYGNWSRKKRVKIK